MVFLYISSIFLNILISHSNSTQIYWFYAELILIIAILIFQTVHTRKVISNIKELSRIFSNSIIIKSGFVDKINLRKKEKPLEHVLFLESSEDNSDGMFSDSKIVKVTVAETSGNGIIKRICNDINNYLLNNYGATVNFSIIKDIVDREVDLMDEKISNSIPTPLYLGLTGTMIGIILGLFSLPELNGENFSNGIQALINGVKLAMGGSFCGILCIIFLTYRFNKAKERVLTEKNKQISYLQAMLLPELLKAEESGISGLKANIEKFSRDSAQISAVVYNTSIKTGANLVKVNEIIESQKEIIQKIESIGVTRVSKVNLELLDKLEKNLYAFNQFANYLDLMGRISNQLQDFASRTSNIDSVTKHIENSLKDNRKLIEFLSAHFDKIENAGNAALYAVDIADSHFRDAIGKLSYSTETTLDALYKSINESSSRFAEAIDNLIREIHLRIEKINQNANDYESKISDIYKDVGAKLQTITDDYLRQLDTSLKESSPKFDKLTYLTELPKIKEQFINDHNEKKFIDIVIGLNDSVSKVNEKFNQQNLMNKLSSIEDTLKKRRHEPGALQKPDEAPNPQNSRKGPEPLTMRDAIKNLFKIKKNGK